ncbi:sulfite oxidase [Longispora fulva]|uniref:DMSO/TMAO reductase YedYZ molybdopterin-dependent catalytic subunit n=1 Tax=Longispora fulva TaxID=619741 RepID=A0A8J7GPR3_9ACTN|nr:sulfite oxidase [Longispora fulva]MBG6141038.1 DMSO/TMAO reductase YedYZ molybdopterin-dependent catalytic subunit [Longispora fulva]GIG60692.1 sulfite oxidase [Longispora fulva]
MKLDERTAYAQVSAPARLAGPGEGISAEELALAARNHGMPQEALRYDVTPVGLHYLLTHYDIPAIDPAAWRLAVSGGVHRPLTLDLHSLRALPARTVRVTMECAGNGRARLDPRPVSQPWLVDAVGTADWTGAPLRDLLAVTGLAEDAVEIVFTGADHGVERGVEQDYQRSLPIAEALGRDVLLAYAMNGAPLPPQHGAPVRLIVPGWYGMAHVKWLKGITVTAEPFTGYQQQTAYNLRQQPDDPGEPVTRIRPRAMLIPPGFPDFLSRARIVHPGPVLLRGRAWSGGAPVKGVAVSTDGGTRWAPAILDDPDGHPWAWRGFSFAWRATPGEYLLAAHATDESGATQPTTQSWNRGGFANNAIHLTKTICVPEEKP